MDKENNSQHGKWISQQIIPTIRSEQQGPAGEPLKLADLEKLSKILEESEEDCESKRSSKFSSSICSSSRMSASTSDSCSSSEVNLSYVYFRFSDKHLKRKNIVCSTLKFLRNANLFSHIVCVFKDSDVFNSMDSINSHQLRLSLMQQIQTSIHEKSIKSSIKSVKSVTRDKTLESLEIKRTFSEINKGSDDEIGLDEGTDSDVDVRKEVYSSQGYFILYKFSAKIVLLKNTFNIDDKM